MKPDLNHTPLSAEQASVLASIAGAAIIQLGIQADNAMDVVRKNGPGHWQDQHRREHDRARGLQDAARRLEKAARRRERDAVRDECIAVRVIHAFCCTIMGKCIHCAGPVVTILDGDPLCLTHANAWVRAEGQAFQEHEAERHSVAA